MGSYVSKHLRREGREVVAMLSLETSAGTARIGQPALSVSLQLSTVNGRLHRLRRNPRSRNLVAGHRLVQASRGVSVEGCRRWNHREMSW